MTDHRIGLSVHQLPTVLQEGNLDPLIQPLISHFQAQKMEEAGPVALSRGRNLPPPGPHPRPLSHHPVPPPWERGEKQFFFSSLLSQGGRVAWWERRAGEVRVFC